MDALCSRGNTGCQVRALAAALHALHLYCAVLATAFISCCAPKAPSWYGKRASWRGQSIRGVASIALGVVWSLGAAAGLLRHEARTELAAALLAPLGWTAAAWLHVALWTRHCASPLLYLAVYWLLAAAASAAAFWHDTTRLHPYAVDIYIQGLSMTLTVIIAVVDCVCFYDEVTKGYHNRKTTEETDHNVVYEHAHVHFYSKISFFWLNSLLHKGYESPLETEDLGELPDSERSITHYYKLKRIYKEQANTKDYDSKHPNLWHCYIRMVWPNFYLAGILKLLGDLLGLVPPLGLAVVISYLEGSVKVYDPKDSVTFHEFINNGYVMLFLMTLSLIAQAFLSQNSTHLVTVEGTRLKTALQGMIYDKCMRLAPWASSMSYVDEESPLLHSPKTSQPGQPGLLTNLISQDTYNIMSCVWICHYTWAIPLKVSVILYLLYTKLGLSAIIGSAVSIMFITPMQFYIGKKISDNSKDIAKCSDHRVSKMVEILQGINVIKLYVWEDLFKEKILNLREVELKHLNKDSIHWNFLTFSTQISTILVTVVTFSVYSCLNNSKGLTAVNVFAGVALFNQLTVPLLILPVTVLMIIQAMVSSKRIKDFLDLPESNNNPDDYELMDLPKNMSKFNDAFIERRPQDTSTDRCKDDNNSTSHLEVDHFSDEDIPSQTTETTLLKFQNAVFSWGMRSDSSPLEIDDLEIPAGKLIMIVGPTGSGKSSLLSAVLGEMYLEKGDVVAWNGTRSVCYSGQPPWLLEGSVRDNIVMDGPWCQRRYARVLRATGLRPDLQLMPDGDSTVLGSHGTPLSGGQRVRVGVARALYSRARLVALDEPLGALDASLARHVVARALVPAARSGRTVLLATNRLELMHYADLIIVMEDGRVSSCGRVGGKGPLARWTRLAAEARAAAAQGGAGPSGGTARERSRLVRALSRARFQRSIADDVSAGMCEVTGAHLLTEMAVCGGGSWRNGSIRQRPMLSRQLSSPPPSSLQLKKCRQDVRRVMSADASDATIRREVNLMRFLRPRPPRTLARWTPRSIRRLISSESDTATEDNKTTTIEAGEESALDTSITSNGVETIPIAKSVHSLDKEPEHEVISDCALWWGYGLACGWWGVAYWAAAAGAQALAVAADCWLAHTTAQNAQRALTDQQMWDSISKYAAWCVGGAALAGLAQAACACAGARARRVLHERLLHAALHAPLHYHHASPLGAPLHRFSADVQVIDKKLPTAVSRWAQLALLCGAAGLVNAYAAPWSLLALVPSFVLYLLLQTVYLRNARELQHAEARSAAPIVSLARQTSAGGPTIRAACLQPALRDKFMRRLDANHNALLLLNAANRWLGLGLDLVGAAAVCVSMGLAIGGGSGGALAGLAGAHSLLLPAYLAHLAKCRADLDQHLAAVERVQIDTNAPQEDYRDDCPIPPEWQRLGKIEFEDVSVQHEPGAAPIVTNVNLSVQPGEKLAVCGRSGSGKSTLLMSCVGAATVCKGRILVDGADVSKVPLRVLRHRLVVLPQEATLFSGTLRENLDPLCVHTDQEIWQSLRAVGLFDFVAAQSAGLECPVGREHGCSWSAGRRARACAARAVLRAPLAVALLLDEPAAALDAYCERTLLAAIAHAAPNTTIITVAHRISSVSEYDRAVVVDRGRVAEQGSPAALLAQPASRLARGSAALPADTEPTNDLR